MKKILFLALLSSFITLWSCHNNHTDDNPTYELTFKLTENGSETIATTVNKQANFKLFIERKGGGYVHNLSASITTEDGKKIKDIIDEHVYTQSPYTLSFEHTFTAVGKYKIVALSTDGNEAQPNNFSQVIEVK